MSRKTAADFLVIGGGIVGVTIARELKRRFSDQSVILIEKETDVGLHASGRNSGVIHAGFYYSANSLKARLTRQGNLALRAYCEQRGIPVLACGKLVVAQDENDLPQLDELLRRGAANGVPLQSISAGEAAAIEPRAKTFERAIFSPSTASADPRAVISALRTDAEVEGVSIIPACSFLGRKGDTARTSQGDLPFGHLVNAAGLYADRVARDFGFSQRYRILPFKGLYLYSNEPVGSLGMNIYPVPDLRNPFLGVHFTVRSDGHIKIGPTAIPALWRENYQGWANFRLGEMMEVMRREAGLMIASDFDFKKLAFEEVQKMFRRRMVELASRLATGVKLENFTRWGPPGIRAQLLDVETKKLVMDFLIEGDGKSTHVLNAVSPGWTCALPFACDVVDTVVRNQETR